MSNQTPAAPLGDGELKDWQAPQALAAAPP